jgi:2-iminobutanoate/2-iminopropanoate deaminase
MRSPITTDLAPAVIGPYSQAIVANGFVFASGQTPIDPQTGQLIKGGVEAQTRRALDNLVVVLEAAGTSFARVVKVTVFLKDMNDFQLVNKVYAEYFKAPYPARSTIEAARLPLDCQVEIEMIALTGAQD